MNNPGRSWAHHAAAWVNRPGYGPTLRLLADPDEIEDPDQLGVVVDVEGQETPSGAEHGPAVGRVVAGWHHDRIPGRLHQFRNPLQRRVEGLAGQTAELDQGGALEPDPIGHRRCRRPGQSGTISSIGTDPSRLPARTASRTLPSRASKPGSEYAAAVSRHSLSRS
jgi:hypothetical protein